MASNLPRRENQPSGKEDQTFPPIVQELETLVVLAGQEAESIMKAKITAFILAGIIMLLCILGTIGILFMYNKANETRSKELKTSLEEIITAIKESENSEEEHKNIEKLTDLIDETNSKNASLLTLSYKVNYIDNQAHLTTSEDATAVEIVISAKPSGSDDKLWTIELTYEPVDRENIKEF